MINKEINVVSLFDGMSCGQQALFKNKQKINKYYASEIEIHAMNVTRKNFPKTEFIGDVTKVSGYDFEKIDLLIGGSPCFVAGTKIITDKGEKNIEDIIIGDLVLTHKNRFKKVLKTGNEKKEIKILKVKGILDTETTDNHPYYVKENLDANPIWKEIKNIDIYNDHVGFHKSEIKNIDNNNYALIDDIAWINIEEIIDTKEEKQVFNIEVEHDNSYTANKLIVHNCQGFSFSGKRLNFNDPRSALFFEYVRILEELREINPDIKFLLENVVMEKKHEKVITEYLGVEPIKINSSLVSGQQRNRLYWTNIKQEEIKDKNIFWDSIQIKDPDNDVMYYSEQAFEWLFKDEKRKKRYKEYTNKTKTKMQMLEASHSKGYSNQRCFGVLDENGKVRYIHPIECERLQNVKDNYSQFGIENHTQYFYKSEIDVFEKDIIKKSKIGKFNSSLATSIKRENLSKFIEISAKYLKDQEVINLLAEIKIIKNRKTNLKELDFNIKINNNKLIYGIVSKDNKLKYSRNIEISKKDIDISDIDRFINILKEEIENEKDEIYIKLSILTLLIIKSILISTNYKIIWSSLKIDSIIKKDRIESEIKSIKIGRFLKISRSSRYRMLGNGWTVDIISNLLKRIND